ncbi:MAG: saccharopine dehydrogenase family protein, partial [bacterium]
GTLEACHTSGGSSTLPVTYLGKVKTLNYKTLRYPGHFRRIKLLKDLGFFDEELIDVGTIKLSPQKFTEKILLKRLGWAEQDLVVVKVNVTGMKDGTPIERTGFLYYEAEKNHKFSAMAQTTGFSTAIVVQLLIDHSIKERGTLFQERHIPSARFFDELEKRDIRIKWMERTFLK